MKKESRIRLISTAACMAVFSVTGGSAFANDASDEARTSDEIVVSARRVSERLQDVPVAVSAVSADTLDDLNVRTPDQLNAVIPNVAMVQVSGSPTGNVAYIRGIGNGDPNVALEPPVATYIDGVYIGRMTAANLELADVERIEVLRGPQGTLFGRNTTGGAISVVTKTPSADFGFEQRLTVAERGEFISRTRVSTGNIGQTGLRATAAYLHRQRDGSLNSPNLPDSRDPGANSLDSVWLRVHGEWGALTADYTFDMMDGEFMNGAFQIRAASDTFMNVFGKSESLGGTPIVVEPDGRVDNLNVLETDPIDIHTHGHALTLNLQLSDALSIKSISAYRKYRRIGETPYGPDGLLFKTNSGSIGDLLVYNSKPDQYQNQISQELQAYGSSGDFSYIAGLFYFREKTREDGLSKLYYAAYNIVYPSVTIFDVKSTAKAAYGQINYRPSWADERFEIAGGLRYSRDHKAINQTASKVRSADQTWTNTSYNITASYKVTPDVMVFARMGTGYRAGGFSTRASGADWEFKPEKAKVYELGFKSEFFDRAVRFNLTGFITKYKDLQVTQFDGVTAEGTKGGVLSAAADYKGFEAELSVHPVAGLTLYSNVGYTDAKYKRIFYPNPSTTFLENYADEAFFAYQPKWTLANGISYSHSLDGIGELGIRLDHTYTSSRVFAATPLAIAPWTKLLGDKGHNVFNARVSLSKIPVGQSLEADVAIWGENIFSEEYIVSGIDFGSLGFGGGVYSEPAQFGVDLTVRY